MGSQFSDGITPPCAHTLRGKLEFEFCLEYFFVRKLTDWSDIGDTLQDEFHHDVFQNYPDCIAPFMIEDYFTLICWYVTSQ